MGKVSNYINQNMAKFKQIYIRYVASIFCVFIIAVVSIIANQKKGFDIESIVTVCSIYLRKSVVRDPLLRENTGDNTPAIIHYDIVPGDQLEITIAPKGFGSENMSKVYMLKPADGEEGIRQSVLAAVKDAGPNACPPMVVGVGLGGDFELAAKLAKKALTRPAGSHSEKAHIAKLEDEILELVNKTGIGPGGLGGKTTALAVNIETYATHIAGMPLAVNMCCHVNRHKTVVL